MNASEGWTIDSKMEQKISVIEIIKLRCMSRVTKEDRIRNNIIRGKN